MDVRWFMFLRNYVNVFVRPVRFPYVPSRIVLRSRVSASLPIADIIERNLRDRRVNDREIGGDQRDRDRLSRWGFASVAELSFYYRAGSMLR